MKIKRVLGLALTIVLILGAITAFGTPTNVVVERAVPESVSKDADKAVEEAKISKEEAIKTAKEKAKELFDFEIDDKDFSRRIQFREDYSLMKDYMWDINWSMNNNDKSLHINVWINGDTGKLRRIFKREYFHNQSPPSIANITEDEAKKIVENFIKKINPEEYKKIQLIENQNYPTMYRDTNYRFRYNRVENDIAYDGNYINVEVDGIKGEIIAYEYLWDEKIDFPSASGIIDDSKAEKLIKENIDMNLTYIPYSDTSPYTEKAKGVKLVYNPRYLNGYLLDAKKGEIINTANNLDYEEKTKDLDEKRKNEILKKAVSSKSTDLEAEMDQQKATQLIKDYIEEIYGEGYEIENLSYVEDENYYESNGSKAWSARFQKQDSGIRQDAGGNISIDALSGNLISVYMYLYSDAYQEEFEPAITWEEGYDKAIDTIEKYFPDKIDDIETEVKYVKSTHYVNGKKVQEREFHYGFGRLVKGIPYRNNHINISMDIKTGELRSIRYRWDEDVEFPEAKGTIGADKAEEIYFNFSKPELLYSRINKNNDHSNPDFETKLVYRLTPTQYMTGNIDAFTGKFLDHSGNEVGEAGDAFKERIQGHKDEKKLSILASQGIIDPKEFELEKKITLEKAIEMLVNAKGYNTYLAREVKELKFSNVGKEDSNYKYLQLAIRYGILDNENIEFKGQDKVTREELAQMITKLLGYDRIGKKKDIFRLSFADAHNVDEEKVGYVAISEGLEIIEVKDNKFRPKDSATMGETAVAIYNALTDIRK